MEYTTNDQIFGKYQLEDEDPDAPDGFCNMYLEKNCFDFQDNVGNDHEGENHSDLEQVEAPFKRQRLRIS